MKKVVLLAVLAALVVAAASPGAPIVLQASKDNPLASGGGGVTNKGLGGLAYTEAAETLLLQFDFSGVVLGPNQIVESASLELFSGHVGGYKYDWQVAARPLRSAWGEGQGVPSDGYGGTGFPWGPVSVGDATHMYREVTAVGVAPAGHPFAGQVIATDGIPWEVPGGTGTNQDAYPQLMINQAVHGPQAGYPPGTSLAVLDLTAEGCSVLEEWITGALPNYGLVLSQAELASGSNWRLAMREFGMTPGTAPCAFAPTLTLNIVTVPEPLTLGLLGVVAALRLRRRVR